MTDQLAAGEKLVSSALTITEHIAGVKAKNAAEQLLAINGITYIDISQEIAILAGALQHKHTLKIDDVIHLATSIHTKCSMFITNDQKLAKVAAKYATVINL